MCGLPFADGIPELVPYATAQGQRLGRAFGAGAAVGGLVGLGGAEFWLPLLIGMFAFAALEAVIVSKAMSLLVVLVVLVAVPARLLAVPGTEVVAHLDAVLNRLAGALAGTWVGASWAAIGAHDKDP